MVPYLNYEGGNTPEGSSEGSGDLGDPQRPRQSSGESNTSNRSNEEDEDNSGHDSGTTSPPDVAPGLSNHGPETFDTTSQDCGSDHHAGGDMMAQSFKQNGCNHPGVNKEDHLPFDSLPCCYCGKTGGVTVVLLLLEYIHALTKIVIVYFTNHVLHVNNVTQISKDHSNSH
jgi:hypothetical protein